MNHPKKDRSRLGRPALPRNKARTERVVTFLTPKQKQQLRLFAKASDLSLSTAAQDLIERSLKHEISSNTDKKEEII